MKRLALALVEAILKPISHVVTVLVGGYTLLWGLWLANPFWDVFTRAPLYNEMRAIAPEWLWGLFAMFCGVLILLGVTQHKEARIWHGSAVAGWHWMLVAYMYFKGDWSNTGGITCVFISITSIYIYLNTKLVYKRDRSLS